MSAASESKPAPAVVRFKYAIWVLALLVGIGIGAAIKLTRSHHSTPLGADSSPVTTFAAGTRPAPGFSLLDQDGRPVSLAAYKGRPVLLTFIDPYCRDFCPREARVLSAAAKQLGPTAPAIVAVSVDPWADTARNFESDATHWKLVPGWRWGVGTVPKLSTVWKSYEVGVSWTTQKIAGVTIRKITHTGAAFLIDGSGDERAIFLYPFTTAQVVGAAKSISA
jgi:protein SCO1/2